MVFYEQIQVLAKDEEEVEENTCLRWVFLKKNKRFKNLGTAPVCAGVTTLTLSIENWSMNREP